MIDRIGRNLKDLTFYTDYEIKLSEEKSHAYLNYAYYYIVENVFNNKELNELNTILSEYDARTEKGTVIGKNEQQSINQNYRNSDIFFVNDVNAIQKYEDRIVQTVEEVNKNIFNLDLTSHMTPQYTVYREDMYFDWHPDGPFAILDGRGLNCIPKTLSWRKLSAVLCLTQEDKYTGGDFQIMLPNKPDQCINTIRMDAGSMILFPAFLSHRVMPVKTGTRKTLVYWFCGPRWK
jgi:PKHD-type hydroxylase